MARIFITGSADGLGHMVAKLLADQGHHVVLHARNTERGEQALRKVPTAEKVLTADLSSIEEIKKLAAEVNAIGGFDAVIHNAGVYYRESGPNVNWDDQMMFTVNSLAPYILTCLIQKPRRLIYLSSGMHLQGDPSLNNLISPTKRRSGFPTYSDTKLHDLILCLAVARKWPDVYANAVNPGWVPTKMGGTGASGNLEKGAETQAWLAVSNDDKAKVSGRYFYHMRESHYLPAAGDAIVQEKFLSLGEQISGVRFTADQ
jgi:NAD(P)-dependent dehydrogenase (short-subunit alcohol dehydrogenase family)